MLRITPSKAGAAQVKNYFIKHASMEAYYSEGQDFNGIWIGKGAERLGLTGSLREEAFSRLCDNLHPATGEQLTARMKENRRVGYDVNFHVPKSVSLAYFYSRDERIIRAIRQAAYDTLLDMQEQAATRVRKNGRDEDRLTQELVGAEFLHMTARPVDGVPDPHLHIHCYVFNATFDQEENAWKALQFGQVMEETNNYQKAFFARLATRLKALGLEILSNKFAFEVGGVERPLIEKFSRRTKTIDAEAESRGIIDPAEKDKLGALTREKKVHELTISQLEPLWWARLSADEVRVLEGIKADLQRTRDKEPTLERTSLALGSKKQMGKAAGLDMKRGLSLNRATRPKDEPKTVVEPTELDRKAVAFAVEHIFERRSVVTEMQLIGEAFENWNYGQATLEGVRQAIRTWPLIRVERDGTTLLTTPEVLAEEDRLLDRCIHGKWKHPAINPTWEITDPDLNAQQQAAVLHVLRSEDFITGISGKAGTGKTTLLREAKRGIEASRKDLLVLAPTAEAARDVLRKEGFENAETVAQLLVNPNLQRQARGAVWWVDEAGLLSTRQADRLIELAAQLDARVVLVGDTGQHHAVERGQAFDLLQKFGRLSVEKVEEIQRQKGAYKCFVEAVTTKDFDRAFRLLDHMDAIFETSLEERQTLLAQDYVAVAQKGQTALVVAPTHVECDNVTQGIRQGLKEKGVLKEGVSWSVLHDLSWSKAQKRDPRHYRPGLVVKINRRVKGYSVGEPMEVLDVKEEVVRVRSQGGIKAVPLSRPDCFNVYERGTMEICKGECVRITANGRSADGHPLHTGKTFKVDYFSPEGEIVLENGWCLGKEFAHLDYGYTTTSHAAQGKTVDWVFVAQSAQLSSKASDIKQFYVSTSRGREGVKVYTDSIDLLRENVARHRERPMATEIMAERESQREQEMTVDTKSTTKRKLGTVSRERAAEAKPSEYYEALRKNVVHEQERPTEVQSETGKGQNAEPLACDLEKSKAEAAGLKILLGIAKRLAERPVLKEVVSECAPRREQEMAI